VAVYKFGVGPELENGTAFVLGLCAMNLIPLIKKALAVRAERLADGDDQKKGTP
jgi:hypothetical protein